ncbi:MAG: plasmid segregation centromere-binding protein ParR [Clostridiales bacterium]|nr:plasmid segregation centromere-binding protein ParR [Clostridiales bacterium]
MTRPRYAFRPNLQNAEHRRAWQLLQAVPEGQRNSFLVQTILEHERRETLEETLRRVLREEGKCASIQPAKEDEPDVPPGMMGFLASLTGDG